MLKKVDNFDLQMSFLSVSLVMYRRNKDAKRLKLWQVEREGSENRKDLRFCWLRLPLEKSGKLQTFREWSELAGKKIQARISYGSDWPINSPFDFDALAHKRFLKALIKTVILFFCYFLSWIFLIISILRKTSELFYIF